MKLFKYFVSGLLFLLIVEAGIFLYIDRIYLNSNGTYSSEKISDDGSKKKENVKIDTNDAENLQCSYDGFYISYIKNGRLIIVSMSSGKSSKIYAEDGGEILNYKWIYDRNRIVIAEKAEDDSDKPCLKLYFYDTADKVKTQVENALDDRVVSVPLSSPRVTVSDIDMSTLTNLTYFKLTDEDGKSVIYRMNVNSDIKKLSTKSSVGKIMTLKSDDELFYEDSKNDNVIRLGGRTLRINGDKKLRILGVDSDDNAYFASCENGETKLIYFGSVQKADWKKISLMENVNINDITIGADGGVYYVDKGNQTMKNLLSGTETGFKGRFIGIYSGGFLTQFNGKVTDNVFSG
ncbi:MAG: hypothetical protein Q8878_00435 [Bacillota bacterium]|nr:hypothetical protein [Bacillota bacterium]